MTAGAQKLSSRNEESAEWAVRGQGVPLSAVPPHHMLIDWINNGGAPTRYYMSEHRSYFNAV